jgi:hypothetical protein
VFFRDWQAETERGAEPESDDDLLDAAVELPADALKSPLLFLRTIQTSIAAQRVLLAEKQIVLKELVSVEHRLLIRREIV